MLCPLVVAFGLAALITAFIVYERERSLQVARREQVLSGYANALSKPLWDCDSATVRGIVETLVQVPIVVGAQVHDICAGSMVERGDSRSQLLRQSQEIQQAPVHYVDELNRAFKVGLLEVQFKPLPTASIAVEVFLPQLLVFAVMLAGATLVFRRTIGNRLSEFRLAILAHRSVQDNEAALGRRVAERNDELTDVVQAYDELMRELEDRFARQETLAQCARILLSSSAATDSPLLEVLHRILQAVHGDRIYLAENVVVDGVLCATITTMAGAPAPGPMQSVQPYAPDFLRWQDCFEGRSDVMDGVSSLPASERDSLVAAGVRSVVALPVWGHAQWYGYLCIQDFKHERHWSGSECFFLRTVADMIGAFLEDVRQTKALDAAVLQLRENERELKRLARQDALTGLVNRISLEEQLVRAVHRADRERRHGYVLLLDLDEFKPINDTYGHAAGDHVLQVVARRLVAAVRAIDTVARLGGDEFVVVVEGQGPSSDLPKLIDKLTSLVSAPMEFNGSTLRVQVSIGAARFPDEGQSGVALLARADRSMYEHKRSKQHGRDGHRTARVG